jgi:hypothetical protein
MVVQTRREDIVGVGLEYRPGDPVRVRVVHRDHRVSVTDDGAAVVKAGLPCGWEEVCARLAAELNVNISRQGVVGLPVVRIGPSEPLVVERIGRASLALYEDLLDLGAAS